MMAAKRGPVWLWARTLAVVALLVASCRGQGSDPPSDKPIIDLTSRSQIDGFGETRGISFGNGDRSHLRDGWSMDEHDRALDLDFVWATSLDANVSFKILQLEDQQVLVNLRAFSSVAPQVVTVLVNGSEVSHFTAAPIFLEYRFVIPAEVLRRGENQLTFHHSVLSPHPEGLEPRRFAAAYHSILMGPQCLSLRGFGAPPRPRIHRREGNRSQPATLLVTGPALVHKRLRVPPDSILRYRLLLPSSQDDGAISTLRIRDGESTREMAETRLSRPWFGERLRDVEVDLSPWSGRTVDLELEVGPLPCRSSVATVIIERAGIFAAGAQAG
jgi:hypothetical protein